MAKTFKGTITAKDTEITVLSKGGDDDYISLTDIARYKNPFEPKDVVANWMRLRNTIEYLGIWEQLYNPDFKGVEFDAFFHEAGSNAFTLSPQRWIDATNAIGIISRSGRGGGTFAHKDIAFKFASWIIEQLLVLANLENINALYISNGMPQSERIVELNRLARLQLAAIIGTSGVKQLNALSEKSVEGDPESVR